MARLRLVVSHLLLILTAMLAVAAPNAAGLGRSVRGRVTDQQDQPLRGAVVKIKNARTLQVRSYVTQSNGEYRFHGLQRDVDYELKARYRAQTSKTKTLHWYDARREASIDFKIHLARDEQRSPTAFLTDIIEDSFGWRPERRTSE